MILIIDELLETTLDKDISWFQKFKEYPDSASISVLQEYLKRYNKLDRIDLSTVNTSIVSAELSKYLCQLIKYYNAYQMKRFKPAKRYSLMVLFLNKSKKARTPYFDI